MTVLVTMAGLGSRFRDKATSANVSSHGPMAELILGTADQIWSLILRRVCPSVTPDARWRRLPCANWVAGIPWVDTDLRAKRRDYHATLDRILDFNPISKC